MRHSSDKSGIYYIVLKWKTMRWSTEKNKKCNLVRPHSNWHDPWNHGYVVFWVMGITLFNLRHQHPDVCCLHPKMQTFGFYSCCLLSKIL